MVNQILQLVLKLDKNKYIVSKQLYELCEKRNISKFKYIFVADNPGKNETNGGDYLSNKKTSNNFETFIKNYLNTNSEDCLILNKSLFQTNQTIDLRQHLNEDESQELIANLIISVLGVNKSCYVVLLGWTDYFDFDDDAIFRKFYKVIKDSIKKNKSIEERFLAFRHPSRGQFFTEKERNKIENENLKIDKTDFFVYCGRKQFISRMPQASFDEILDNYKEKLSNTTG